MTRKKSRKARGAQAGFTLVEMLVVVLIIASLAAIALPKFGKALETSKVTEGVSTLATTAANLESEYARTGIYPAVAKGIANNNSWAYAYNATSDPKTLTATRKTGDLKNLVLTYQRVNSDWCWDTPTGVSDTLIAETGVPTKNCP